MDFAALGFCVFTFTGLTLTNRFLEGAVINSVDVAMINNVLVLRTVEVFNLFSVPIPNLCFFTDGLPALIKWDYSFFGGNSAILVYLLYSITAVVGAMFFMAALGLMYNYFGRR